VTNWNWEPNLWKKSTKVLLAMATVWPPIYMVLFFITIFSFVLLIPFEERRGGRNSRDIDLIQLDRKVKNGEIKEITITGNDIIAVDRNTGIVYRTYVSNESTKAEIIKEAKELDSNGRTRVDKIDEYNNQAPPGLIGLGFVTLFAVHLITILLMIGLMPLYIILVVKSDRLDQTMRIVWVVLICMLGMFAMPVYWYLYVWRNGPAARTVENPS
jgi:ATP-dependent Zn protease